MDEGSSCSSSAPGTGVVAAPTTFISPCWWKLPAADSPSGPTDKFLTTSVRAEQRPHPLERSRASELRPPPTMITLAVGGSGTLTQTGAWSVPDAGARLGSVGDEKAPRIALPLAAPTGMQGGRAGLSPSTDPDEPRARALAWTDLGAARLAHALSGSRTWQDTTSKVAVVLSAGPV